MKMHKNYAIKQETFKTLLPQATTNQVADWFAEGKSETDIVGLLRVNNGTPDKKVSLSIIKEVFRHIKIVEKTCINILEGDSVIYQDRAELAEDHPLKNEPIPAIPTEEIEFKTLVANIIAMNLDHENSIYDVTIPELLDQIKHVVDNVIKYSDGTGNATFDYYKTAIQGE